MRVVRKNDLGLERLELEYILLNLQNVRFFDPSSMLNCETGK